MGRDEDAALHGVQRVGEVRGQEASLLWLSRAKGEYAAQERVVTADRGQARCNASAQRLCPNNISVTPRLRDVTLLPACERLRSCLPQQAPRTQRQEWLRLDGVLSTQRLPPRTRLAHRSS